MRKIIIGLFVVSIMVLSCTNRDRTINISGKGTVTFVPNMVSLTITVKNINMKLNDSLVETKKTIISVLEVCKKYGIQDLDIKSSYINTGKEYYWDSRTNQNVFQGYSATQTTQILFRKLADLEALSSDLLGLNISSMDNIVFDHSEKEKYEADANLLALDNAKQIAQKIAERMDVELKEIMYITDLNANENYNNGYNLQAYSKSLSTGIIASPGILTIDKNVQIVYAIK